MSAQPPNRISKRRRTALLLLAAGIFLLFSALFSSTAFNLTFIRPDTVRETMVFAALSALIFLLFVALTFVLARNVLKLIAERRMGVLGSAFRTRMLLGALALSFLPVIFLFLFAYGLMNRSIDKWFSRPVEELREDSSQVASLLSSYASANARSEANSLAASPGIRRALSSGIFAAALPELTKHEPSLQGGFVVLVHGDETAGVFRTPATWPEMRPVLMPALISNDDAARMVEWGNTEYMVGRAPLSNGAQVLVGMPLPPHFTETLQKIEASQRKYFELSSQRKLLRRTYMIWLLLLTVMVLFAATWLSLFVARLVTRPVAALAEATREISAGHLDFRVQVSASDELGELVASFNRMAAELENSRREIESSRHELGEANIALSRANAAIDQRHREIATILQNIPTGVLSLDTKRRVTHSNRAFGQLFSPVSPEQGVTLDSIFNSSTARDLEHLLRQSDRMGTAAGEMEISGAHGIVHAAVTVASLQNEKQRLGYAMVFEDMSDVLKAQKAAAWREVARRVAHEIKNPLTPIALSAERIRRHLNRGHPPEEASLAVMHGCAETISGAVETLRTLVDEFSTLARFPTSRLQPANLNAIVGSALGLFEDRLEGILMRVELADDLPLVLADPEAMKRVVANLVDNAASATQDALVREIHIATGTLDGKDAVELVVADTGHGVSNELKEKLFLPYFSTKDRGTGLGLAIVSRIIEEHRGTVRVEKNYPVGAKFIVELPLAARTEGTQIKNGP